jgi:hypothetical protein
LEDVVYIISSWYGNRSGSFFASSESLVIVMAPFLGYFTAYLGFQEPFRYGSRIQKRERIEYDRETSGVTLEAEFKAATASDAEIDAYALRIVTPSNPDVDMGFSNTELSLQNMTAADLKQLGQKEGEVDMGVEELAGAATGEIFVGVAVGLVALVICFSVITALGVIIAYKVKKDRDEKKWREEEKEERKKKEEEEKKKKKKKEEEKKKKEEGERRRREREGNEDGGEGDKAEGSKNEEIAKAEVEEQGGRKLEERNVNTGNFGDGVTKALAKSKQMNTMLVGRL